MAEIILFRPNATNKLIPRCSLGLVYLATTLLHKGYSVEIIDQGVLPDWRQKLKQVLKPETICAGVSVMTGSSIRAGLEFSKFVKENSTVPIVWGGIHPSLLPAQTVENEFIDVVVIGEGENKFSEIVECIKKGKPLDNVKGIVFKKGREAFFTAKDETCLDMDSLPVPEFDKIDIEYYAEEERKMFGGARGIDLNVDRGCPYRCAFCYNIEFNRRRWRAISAGRILEIVGILKDKYNLGAVNFVSDNFFVDKKRVHDICQGLIDRKINIKWHADIRIDTFLKMDREFLELMKKSGCHMLTFGVESGSGRMLQLIQKDITVEDIFKAHDKVMKLNLDVNYHFMLGFPDETKKDILETLKVAAFLTNYDRANVFGPSMYIPYPGTPLFNRCVELGYKAPAQLEGWINYDWEETSKLPWFNAGYKAFMNEVQTLARGGFHTKLKRYLKTLPIYLYCRMRLSALQYGISFFDIDTKLMRLANSKLKNKTEIV